MPLRSQTHQMHRHNLTALKDQIPHLHQPKCSDWIQTWRSLKNSLSYVSRNKGTLTLPDDIEDEGLDEIEDRLGSDADDCANPMCNRLSRRGESHCCSCCQKAHEDRVFLDDSQHLAKCNQRHQQLYNNELWSPEDNS